MRPLSCLSLILVLRAASADETVSTFVDLSAFHAPLAATGFPAVQSIAEVNFDPYEGEHAEFGWFAFPDPPSPIHSLHPDVVLEIARRMLPPPLRDGLAYRLSTDSVAVWPTAEHGAAMAHAVDAIRVAVAPVRVQATLVAEDGGGPERLVASGAAELAPRRWTRLWQQRDVRRFAVDYDVRVAQEAVANQPIVWGLPHGAELCLRYAPGERTSVVEVCAGVLDHLEPFAVDLSPLRNVPESNSMATVELPRTAVRRCYAAIPIPAGSASRVEIAWEGAGGTRVLRLAFDAATPSPGPVAVDAYVVSLLRAGAALSAFEAAERPGGFEAFHEEFFSVLREECELEPVSDSLLVAWTPPPAAKELRRALEAAEARLRPLVVELRALAVPERAVREWIVERQGALGAAVPSGTLDAFVEAGAVPLASVRLPVLSGVPARVQVGSALATFGRVQVEVAQQSGGLDPTIQRRFEGLEGWLVATAGEGRAVRFQGTLSWARPDGASVELAFRPPVGMAFNREAVRPEDPAVRTHRIPLETYGEAAIGAGARFDKDAAPGAPALLAVLSQGGREGLPETVIVVATVRE